jgi:CHASE2 domain-containing sensor protein/two-component sensor histidine kinase
MSIFPSDQRRTGLAINWLVLNFLLLVLVALLSFTYPVEELSRRLTDSFFRLRVHQPTSKLVAIVAIDDASLEQLGRWPWPRAQVARLVRAVSQQRPQAIGLDVLLPEAGDPGGDKDLAQAIRDAGNVVLASRLSDTRDRAWTDPLPQFRAAAAGVGHVQAVMDADGIGRRVPLLELSGDGPRWPLAVEMARVATGQSIHTDSEGLWLGSKRLRIEGVAPRDLQGWKTYSPQFLTIDFRQQFVPGDPDSPFLVVSAASLMDGRAPALLSGRAVLIGFGASDLSDRIATPVSGQMPMPGVEVHANLLQSLLTGIGIHHVTLAPQLIVLLVFSLVSTWLVLRRPGWGSVWIPLVLFAICYAVGFWFFRHQGVLFEFGPLFCTALLAVPLAQLENLAIVNRALNRGLSQLRGTLLSSPQTGQLPGFQTDPVAQDARADLQQKLELVQTLQSELASSFTFRQNLLESMHEGLSVFDASGKSEFRNQYWERFCEKQGWPPAIEVEELGRRIGHPGWSNLIEKMRDGSLPPESEVYLGGGFWQIRSLSLAPSGSQGPRWMVVVTDLTSRLERDRARAEALRFVTHELRTPLVSIQGFAEFLLRYPNADSSKEAAATIFRESQRLVSLINTYLDVLRFDAGARALRKQSIAIPEMVGQVGKVIAPIAEAADIRILVDLEDALPRLIGDAPMLNGVLLNLLNNAVKYSPEGSEVSLRVRGEIGAVVFEVANPGTMIPPDELARLFEPFYRAPDHDAAKPGWGLGLTFVKRIVEEHGGTIEASSDNDGIRVRVSIPVTGADADPGTGSHGGAR